MTEISHSGPKWSGPNYENGGLEAGPGNVHPNPGVAEQGFYSHEQKDLSISESFANAIRRMTPSERRSLVERHQAFGYTLDGPGGP